jgi:hypothetical protein
MPSHPWFSQPAALDSAVGAGTIGGNMLTDTVPSDLNSVYTDTVRPTEVRMRIIINGAGIAGPTLAYWLRKAGYEVVLVEAAPQLRTGGYVIDFGSVGYDIAEKMGLIPRLRELGYQVGETRFVDRNGCPWVRSISSAIAFAISFLVTSNPPSSTRTS